MIAVVAGEHMALIGPPGTAKSALIRSIAERLDSRYFEYLMTRFSEPNELFGPLDIQAFREGQYRRVIDGMLPESDIIFLDEAFKANSAILNTLLTLLNERLFKQGSKSIEVPLLTVFAASNEVPQSEDLRAIYDRFLLRVYSGNLESFQFQELLRRGMAFEKGREKVNTTINADELRKVQKSLLSNIQFPEPFLNDYKSLCFQLRGEGLSLSDRRVVRCLKLFAANALIEDRSRVDARDFFVLKHVWNTVEQRELLNEIVDPVLELFEAENPDSKNLRAETNIEDMVQELKLIDQSLRQHHEMSELQLFTQLKNLNDIKNAVATSNDSRAKAIDAHIDKLLSSILEQGRFDGPISN